MLRQLFDGTRARSSNAFVRTKKSHAIPNRNHATSKSSSKPGPKKPERKKDYLDYILPAPEVMARGIFTGLMILLGGHVFITYFYSISACAGVSMMPTINSFGDWVLVSKYYRRGREVTVGDVVSFKHPVQEQMRAIKRVVGMPGDIVCRDTPGVGTKMIQVPQGHCWVVGDNLGHSRDSRLFGPLPLALIRGKVIYRVTTSPHWSWPHAVKNTFHDLDEVE